MNVTDRADRIIGSLIGGAAGDALGYEIEFWDEAEIFDRFGECGIQSYEPGFPGGKALISDDTQMTLFTAEGILNAAGPEGAREGIALAYLDWLRTQEDGIGPIEADTDPAGRDGLLSVSELYALRAPGNTCLSALRGRREQLQQNGELPKDFLQDRLNHSKGCGGVMRIAPVALAFSPDRFPGGIRGIDLEGAQAAAVTHGAPLGWLPAAAVTHILNRIVYPERELTLTEIVLEAGETCMEIFRGAAPAEDLRYLNELLVQAADLAENDRTDLENIHALGEGWVGEEAMAVGVYCALRYQNDFTAGIRAAVNHCGDSDSTGAVCGNILGAWLGDRAVGREWKDDLELEPLIREIGGRLAGYSEK